MNVFFWNARARNGHVEATLNHPFPAQVENRDLLLRFPGEEAAAPVENRKGRSHRRGDSLAQYLGL